jgi:hypothetical protein
MALAGPGIGTVISGCCQTLATFYFNAGANSETDVGVVTANTGNYTVNVRYNGQPLPGCRLYFTSAVGGVGCGASYNDVPVGNYSLTEMHGYPFAPVPFTISANHTTTVNVETSSVLGVMTGTVLTNGQSASGLSVRTNHEDGSSSTDSTGHFRLMALAGPGIGTVISGCCQTLATFYFNAVAGQTRDLGYVGPTSFKVLISAKSGVFPNKQWMIRITDIGPASASDTRLDSLSLTQTSGISCTPLIASSFPVYVGFLTSAASGDAPVSIDFSGCAVNARFTATLHYSANTGSTSGSYSIYGQQP